MTKRNLAKRPLTSAAFALLLIVSIGGLSPAHASSVDPVQDELNSVMALQPGGVQVSDNAVVWGDADVVYVVPNKGESLAPLGLGKNIRKSKIRTKALKGLAAQGSTSASTTLGPSSVTAASASSCPHGVGVKDYYCFYQYRNYGGRRVQFTGATSKGRASDWGFNNGTSSWVSWDVDCEVAAFDSGAYSGVLWYEPENSTSSYVGSAKDNRMSSWYCG